MAVYYRIYGTNIYDSCSIIGEYANMEVAYQAFKKLCIEWPDIEQISYTFSPMSDTDIEFKQLCEERVFLSKREVERFTCFLWKPVEVTKIIWTDGITSRKLYRCRYAHCA